MATDREAVTVVGDAADEWPLPPAPTDPDAVVCRCMGVTVGDLDEAWIEGLHRAGAAQARDARRHRDVPGRRLPAARPGLDRGAHRGHAGPVHRPTRRPPDHPRRGRRGRHGRRLPAHAAPRRAPRARRADGPVRWLVATVALRRRGRGVLGGPRGRLDRRRVDPRQARRQRAGRGRGPGAHLPVPRRGHPARPVALRAAAQRARPRHGRRDDPARVRDPVRAQLHERRRGQRRDVAARLDRHVGPPRPRHGSDDVARRDQRHGAARRGAAGAARPGGAATLAAPRPRPRSRRCPATSCACRSRARPPGSCTTR